MDGLPALALKFEAPVAIQNFQLMKTRQTNRKQQQSRSRRQATQYIAMPFAKTRSKVVHSVLEQQ